MNSSKLHAPKVLIVDDDATTIRIAQAICESLNYAVAVACNGRQALDLYEAAQKAAAPIDIIFMDLQMPMMGGYEATIEIRQTEEENNLKKVPIVAITGTVKQDNQHKCLEIGMDDYRQKPYTTEMVKTLIARHVTCENDADFE
ncbi:MAG: response regulator [Alphaproteobacteria bacterium]|nr:response regulator [Alphaproteobacteria bacterium]